MAVQIKALYMQRSGDPASAVGYSESTHRVRSHAHLQLRSAHLWLKSGPMRPLGREIDQLGRRRALSKQICAWEMYGETGVHAARCELHRAALSLTLHLQISRYRSKYQGILIPSLLGLVKLSLGELTGPSATPHQRARAILFVRLVRGEGPRAPPPPKL